MDQLLAAVTAWAQEQEDVRAVLLVGSHARLSPPLADQFSDLDFEIYTTTPDAYQETPDWISSLGDMWVCVPFQRGDGIAEHLILFDEAQKIDLSFLPVSWLEEMVKTQRLTIVYQRGYRVLLDKDGVAAKLPACEKHRSAAERPSPMQFTQVINTFWYGAVYVAKQIRRRNLWTVKYRDWTMKEGLLAMLEWHTQAQHNWQADTWYEGKFLLNWVDTETGTALLDVFGRFDAADSWRALLATMDLFRQIAQETAVSLNYSYAIELDANITHYVTRLYEEDTQ